MKKIYMILGLLASVFGLQAQQNRLDYVHPDDHLGLFKVGSYAAELMRTERAPGNKWMYVLKAINSNLEVTEKSHVAIDQQSRFVTLLSNEKRGVILFQNSANQEIDMVNIGSNGRITSHQTYADNNEDLHQWNGLLKAQMGEDGMLYVSRNYFIYEDAKKRKYAETGVEVLCFGAEYDLKWAQRFKNPDNARIALAVDQLIPFNQGCVAMISENSSADKAYSIGLHFLTSMGKVSNKYELKRDGSTYYPTSFRADGESLIACGMYFKRPWYEAVNSDGMFFLKMDAGGKEVFLQTKDWKSIDETINAGASTDFIFSGKMKVLVQDIYKSDKGYSVICESYQKAGGVTGAELLTGTDQGNDGRAFTVFDFIIFDFDNSGNLQNSRKIEKEKRNIHVRGNIGYTKGVQLSFILRDNYLFSYRYAVNNQLVYMNLEDNEPVLYWANLASGEVLKKKAIGIEPEIIVEEDPAAREMINNSKMLSGLEKFANKVDQTSEKMDEVGQTIERGISKTDQVFVVGSPKLSGLIYLGNDVNINYLLFPAQSELYLKKL